MNEKNAQLDSNLIIRKFTKNDTEDFAEIMRLLYNDERRGCYSACSIEFTGNRTATATLSSEQYCPDKTCILVQQPNI